MEASLGYLGVWILSQKEKRCGGVCLSSQPGEVGAGDELGPREALFLEINSGCGMRGQESGSVLVFSYGSNKIHGQRYP